VATVTNQYGTFETDKLVGGKRLPVTAEEESIAQKLYGKSFKDFTLPNGNTLEGYPPVCRSILVAQKK